MPDAGSSRNSFAISAAGGIDPPVFEGSNHLPAAAPGVISIHVHGLDS